jgi:flagellar hook-associated protein 3 FlgL
MMSGSVLNDLENAANQLNVTQQRISSGKQIQQPSDDPFGTSQALQYSGDLAQNQQYQSNVNDAQGWESTVDTALGNVNDIVLRARDLVVQGASDTSGSSARSDIASEIDQLIDSLKTEANTQYSGRYVFSGTQTLTQPYQVGSSNDSYAGNTGTITREIGEGVQVAVNTPGSTVFGDGTTGLIATLRQISTDLRANNGTALQNGDLTALDNASTAISSQQASVGALSNRLTSATSRLQQLQQATTQQLSNVQDADMAQTLINFSTQQAVYQAALKSGAQIIQPSLMDFLAVG